MEVFKAKDLTYIYPDTTQPAVDGINIEISEGEMVLLVGPSGCGKSSLLKIFAGLIPSFYGGTVKGQVHYRDTDILYLNKPLASKVGMLFQDPEKQLVLTDVRSEIVFGMENTGVDTGTMRRRLAETLDFMGIGNAIKRKTGQLSAGEKQKVALASILAMNPDILLLDEPTSQVDPISAEEILGVIRKTAEDTGKTIVMAEHKLERCLHLADRVAAMKDGRLEFLGGAEEYCRWAEKSKYGFIPPIPRLFSGLDMNEIPITVKQGRMAVASRLKVGNSSTCAAADVNSCHSITPENNKNEVPEISIKNLWYSYDNTEYALKGINLDIFKGQFTAILGQNGAGKSTLVKNINGLLKPVRGHVEVRGQSTKGKNVYELSQTIGYLAQNPDNYLLNDTVEEEIRFTLNNFKRDWSRDIDSLLKLFRIEQYKKSNPRDLSTGEKQRVALASVLSVFPRVLILDEPTRGMDYDKKNSLGELLLDLKKQDITIILITHDIEFAAEFCDRAVILFDGEIVASGTKDDVLKNNLYYSSQVSKLFHGIKDVVTFDRALTEITSIFLKHRNS